MTEVARMRNDMRLLSERMDLVLASTDSLNQNVVANTNITTTQTAAAVETMEKERRKSQFKKLAIEVKSLHDDFRRGMVAVPAGSGKKVWEEWAKTLLTETNDNALVIEFLKSAKGKKVLATLPGCVRSSKSRLKTSVVDPYLFGKMALGQLNQEQMGNFSKATASINYSVWIRELFELLAQLPFFSKFFTEESTILSHHSEYVVDLMSLFMEQQTKARVTYQKEPEEGSKTVGQTLASLQPKLQQPQAVIDSLE